jgi:hypothetical protein
MHGDDLESFEFVFEVLAILGPDILEFAWADWQTFGPFWSWVFGFPGFEVALEVVHQSQWHHFFEGRLELSTFLWEVSFLEVSDAGDPGRFLDNDQEFVDVSDSNIGCFDGFWERFFPELDDIFAGDFSDRVQA